jgi:hypothetical protein
MSIQPRGGHVALALVLLLVTVAPTIAQPVRVEVEPGYRRDDGRWVVPLVGRDRGGAIVPLAGQDLEVAVAGEPAVIAAVTADVPTSVLVIADRALSWEVMADVASEQRAGDDVRFWSADPAVAVPADSRESALPEAAAPRLWDVLLSALESLATREADAARRVVLVVGDLRDEDQSDHPVASVIEAAQGLAIPVYGAVTDGVDAAARRRLARLAAASGGTVVPAATAEAALTAGMARIAAAQGLVIEATDHDLPADARIALVGGDGAANTRVMSRPQGSWRPGAGLVAALVVVLAAAAGLSGWWRWRTRPVGHLEIDDRRRPVPASGLSIGRAADNGLVLNETQVSKHHALVRWYGGQVQLVDLRSTNGTLVNGRPIRSVALADGDEIVFGDAVTLVFRARKARRGIGDGRRGGFVA